MTNRFIQILAFVASPFFGVVAYGQTPTVGVVFQSEQSYDGYTLLPVTSSTNTYLLNNCGEEVNRWTSEYKAGMMAYLLDDGSLIRPGDQQPQLRHRRNRRHH